MPFKSKAQRSYLYSKHPEIAQKWTAEMGSGGSDLPEKAPTEKKKKYSPWTDMLKKETK